MTNENHRTLRVEDHVERRRNFLRRGAAALGVERRRHRRHLDIVLFLENVERDVDIHRARPARQHRCGCLAQRERQHIDPRGLITPLHDRPHDVYEIGLEVLVDFLKRAAVELRRRDIGRNRKHCRGIRQCAGERHDDVAGARPARRQRCNGLVFDAEIGVRHVRGNLLVAGRNQRDAVARLIERIEHPDIAVATNAEHVGNIAGNQIFGNELGALHSRHSHSLPACAGWTPQQHRGTALSTAGGH